MHMLNRYLASDFLPMGRRSSAVEPIDRFGFGTSATQLPCAIGGFGGDVFRIATTKEGMIYSSSADKTARIHKFADGGQVFSLAGHTDWVYSVAFSAASKRVAAGSYTGEVRIWNTDDGKEVKLIIAAPGYAPPTAAAAK